MSEFVPSVQPLSRNDIESHAIRLIRRFYPHLLCKPGVFPVLDFFDLLREEFGLDPGVEQLPDGVEGMTWPDGRVIVSEETYRGAALGKGRSRFTIPHEGYHGIQHRSQIRKALYDAGELILYRRQLVKPYQDPEWQANTFASAILMPASMVRELARKEGKLFLVSTMAEVFQVSPTAAEVRLTKLGISQ